VTHVDGTGAQAKIHKYKLAGPGEHIDGIEAAALSPPAAAPLMVTPRRKSKGQIRASRLSPR